jgi:hypothetical protein
VGGYAFVSSLCENWSVGVGDVCLLGENLGGARRGLFLGFLYGVGAFVAIEVGKTAHILVFFR